MSIINHKFEIKIQKPVCASQEASSRLYLAVLLRRRPLLCEGVVMGLNGARFLDVYVPDIGIELRIQVEDIAPAPVYGDWDAKAKWVHLLLVAYHCIAC